MKVYRDLSANITRHTVATIGIFDGVHRAHKHIINKLTELAKENSTESLLITMWPHPRYILNKDVANLRLISTLDEKLEQLEKTGIDNIFIIPFDRNFASISFDRFIKRFLVDMLQVKHMVIGFNHQFGRNRGGDFTKLKEYAGRYQFGLEQIPMIEVDKMGVSSSSIRENLFNGEIELANKMLGYNYQLRGKVIHGTKIGRKLGFPTANIKNSKIYKIIPADGVYAVQAIIKDKLYKGMLNLGTRPTIDDSGLRVIEANFYDFNEDIYGEYITIRFFKRIREEKKFSTTNDLIHQINLDKEEIHNYFSKNKQKNINS